MTDDMGFDLKLPTVGELTFPQWQDWLARYNAVLGERDARIEKLEAALEAYSCSCSTADEDDCELGDWANISCGYRARKALEGKDE